MTPAQYCPEQARSALEVANRVRSERSVLKRRLRSGEIRFEDVDPDEVASMKALELMRACPWQRSVGNHERWTPTSAKRATRILISLRIPSHATVGEVQKHGLWPALVARMNELCSSQRA